jgi:hypothetical protein
MLPMPEHQQTQQSKKPDTVFQKQATQTKQIPRSNPKAIIQRAKINSKSLTHADVMQLQRTIGNEAVGKLLSGIGNTCTVQQTTVQRQEIPEEEEPLQGKMIKTIQRQPNNTPPTTPTEEGIHPTVPTPQQIAQALHTAIQQGLIQIHDQKAAGA